MKILLVGPQGAGKSTQAKLLADSFHIPAISTGDIFRELATQESTLSEKLKQIMSSGNLVDDETTSKIVKERLAQPDFKNGFVFDGYPRTLKQIEYFDPGFDKVIYLEFADKDARQRLLRRGRADDTPELIDQRLKIYHQLTDPILDYYREQGILLAIDAAGSIDEVWQRVRKVMDVPAQ
ncbi:MAG: nucleoside monophosphate kinase [Candidatus Daviesbacteria bacterium]|nr:nucleoside monophosphate kinase [Candidatus Daviesbacteria bacterium]